MNFNIVYKIFLFALLAGLIYYFATTKSEAKAQEPLPDVGYMYYHDIDALVIDYMFTDQRCLERECNSIFFDIDKENKEAKEKKDG